MFAKEQPERSELELGLWEGPGLLSYAWPSCAVGAAVGRSGACIQGGYSGEVGVDRLYALDRQSFGDHGSQNVYPILDMSGGRDGQKCL